MAWAVFLFVAAVLLFIVVATLSLVALIGVFAKADARYLIALPVMVLAALGAVVSGRTSSRQFDEMSCDGWGRATGREVRFEDVHYFDWRCLTLDSEGRWLDRDAVLRTEVD